MNALYLKAPWADSFNETATKDELFHLDPTQKVSVPTMQAKRHFGYAKEGGYSVVSVPYQTNRLQLVLFVPDKLDGLTSIEKKLTANSLTNTARLKQREVILHLPKFKLEPATMSLRQTLQSLGLKTAFDQPKGSANFNRMAPRMATDYLYIGEVMHKTWLSLDEYGTEATAATVTLVAFGASMPSKPPPRPIEMRVDRPFLFAIQHVDSGVCLFLGRVTDPR